MGRLTQVFGGDSPPRLNWLVGGVPLGSSGSRARLSDLAGVRDSLLTLTDVGPDDSGVYTCRAQDNRCPRAVASMASTSLYVWPHGIHTNEELPGAGMLINPYDEKLTLSCSRQDDSGSVFEWSKNGEPITQGHRVFTTGDTLTVQEPQEDDAGVYECRLRNSNITVTIQVICGVGCWFIVFEDTFTLREEITHNHCVSCVFYIS
ncbi:hypothetical protein MRX96_010174 [Rhipicephalus microplus]